MRTSGNFRLKSREINRGQTESESNHSCSGDSCGSLSVVGIGPGNDALLTYQARETITAADLVIGYRAYLEQIEPLLKGKSVCDYGMTEELTRAGDAVKAAKEGKNVVVVSGGDPGVYGMASPLLELASLAGIELDIIPGVTAATAAAACLGAPLSHDFAVISLSDRLTPWQLICKRLEAATVADFIIVLYNPASQSRVNQIREAQSILLKYRPSETPVGLVKGAYRPEQKVVVSDMGHFLETPITMSTLVIVGNSQTKVVAGKIVTPRGYPL